MRVGVLRIELSIPEAGSLKDKRRIVKSLKERLGNKFSVSVAEVAEQDTWRRAVLGVAVVANDTRFVHRCLDTIVDWIRVQRSVVLVDYDRDVY